MNSLHITLCVITGLLITPLILLFWLMVWGEVIDLINDLRNGK